MSQHANTERSAWTKPVLSRLGQLKDVAPGAPGTTEGGSGKS